jgi:serine/threonine-protein kinase
MGEVWRAYDTATKRVVALKVLLPHSADDEDFQRRFRREAEVAAGLNDPHVVPIHDYGEIDGRLFVNMRLIEGRDLGEVLRSGGSLPPARAVHLVGQVAEALEAAHAVGLVHRDVKPSNILVTPRDFVYLIDFGIARASDHTSLTGPGMAVGTFAYMAPERIKSNECEPNSDIYALTCVLYECLTGQLAFPGAALEQQIAAHLGQPPPAPSAIAPAVGSAFDAVIAKGMAKVPSERYRTTSELADAARAALDAAAPGNEPIAREPIPMWCFSLVLVRLGRRFLLVHERKHGQLWYLPAGRMNPGETFAMAARRKTMQEAGVDVVLEGVLRIQHTPMAGESRTLMTFVARPADDRAPKSVADDDTLGAGWFTVDEMAALPLRSEEVVELARKVLDGALIHPMSLFGG